MIRFTRMYRLLAYGTEDDDRITNTISLKPRHKWTILEYQFMNYRLLQKKISACKGKRNLARVDQPSFTPAGFLLRKGATIEPPRKGDLVHAPDRSKNKNGVILWTVPREDTAYVKFFIHGGVDSPEEVQLNQLNTYELIGARKVWTLEE